MIEGGPNRLPHIYTSGERAWWASCVFRAAHAYASKDGRLRQFLGVGSGDELTEDHVFRAVEIIRDEMPIAWKEMQRKAELLRTDELSRKTVEILKDGGGDLIESNNEARRLLVLEYENRRYTRHPRQKELEILLFASYDEKTGVFR